MATVLLARHGETAWNRDGRVQGWAPTGLTDRGREEARTLADRVGGTGTDRLVTSDLRRARETAKRIAAATDVAPTPDDRWRERDWGRLQGFRPEVIRERFPSLWIDDGTDAMAARPEAGESLNAVRERVLDAWTDLRTSVAPDATAVVVTHAVPVQVVRAAVTDSDPAATIRDGTQGTGAVTEVRLSDGTATLADAA